MKAPPLIERRSLSSDLSESTYRALGWWEAHRIARHFAQQAGVIVVQPDIDAAGFYCVRVMQRSAQKGLDEE